MGLGEPPGQNSSILSSGTASKHIMPLVCSSLSANYRIGYGWTRGIFARSVATSRSIPPGGVRDSNLGICCWQPCVLNCGHVFCKNCIDEWKKKKKLCPMCRAKISSSVRLHKMDSIIDKNVSLLSDEAKARRKCTIHERINGKFIWHICFFCKQI